jgi:hypothetical protein
MWTLKSRDLDKWILNAFLASKHAYLSCVEKKTFKFYEISRASLLSTFFRPLSMKRLPLLLDAYWPSRLFIPEPAQSVAVD